MCIKPAAVKAALLIAAGAAVLYLALRFLLPYFAPFAAAFLLAQLLEPAVKFLCRRGVRREAASGLCAAALLALLAAALTAAVGAGLRELYALSARLPELAAPAAELAGRLRAAVRSWFDGLPAEFSRIIDSAGDSLMELLAGIPARLSEWLAASLYSAAAAAPDIFLFIITCGLAVYFISASYPAMQVFFDTRLPVRWQRARTLLRGTTRFTLGRYVRAQLILAAITFCQLLAGFLLMGTDGAFILALIIALVDALPVFGAGAALIPWAAAELLTGGTARGLGLLALWLTVSLVRSCLQAKLIGDQLGLPPLVTLIAIYAGWKAAGIVGMMLLPMGVLALKQLGESGILRLWKEEHVWEIK